MQLYCLSSPLVNHYQTTAAVLLYWNIDLVVQCHKTSRVHNAIYYYYQELFDCQCANNSQHDHVKTEVLICSPVSRYHWFWNSAGVPQQTNYWCNSNRRSTLDNAFHPSWHIEPTQDNTNRHRT